MDLEKSILDHNKINEKAQIVIPSLIYLSTLAAFNYKGLILDGTFVIFMGLLLLYFVAIHFISKSVVGFIVKRGAASYRNKLRSLVNDTNFNPKVVEVLPLNRMEIFFYKFINKNGFRKAVDSKGNKYSVIYPENINGSFEASLYQVRDIPSSLCVFHRKFAVVPVCRDQDNFDEAV